MQTWGLSLAKKSSQLMVPLTARDAKKSVIMLGLQGMMHVSAARQPICQLMFIRLLEGTAPLPPTSLPGLLRSTSKGNSPNAEPLCP